MCSGGSCAGLADAVAAIHFWGLFIVLIIATGCSFLSPLLLLLLLSLQSPTATAVGSPIPVSPL